MAPHLAAAAKLDHGSAGPALSPPALSVVIPAFNESRRIEWTVARALRFLEKRDARFEIVVVDDGSIDDTAALVRGFAARRPGFVRLVQLGRNRGKGAALRAGVAASRGARVLVMDADLSTPIEELARLEAVLESSVPAGAVAIGSRAAPHANVRARQSRPRAWLGRAGNLWIRALAVPGVQDTQCGFKLLDGEVARTLFALCREDRFSIDIELLRLARTRLGLEIAEVGVAWDHQRGSKVRWRDYVDVLWRTVVVRGRSWR